jgi:hypothetical protein
MDDQLSGEAFGLLCKEFWELERERDAFSTIFQSADDTIELFNSAAPDFCGLLQTLLHDSMALRICRLTDQPTSGSRQDPQDNMTLMFLAKSIKDIPETAAIGSDVIDSAKQARILAEPFRQWRNKVIAHPDLTTATQGFPDDFTNAQLTDVVAQIERCLKLVADKFSFGIDIQNGTDVRGLIRHLRAAKPELERQRKIEDAIIEGWAITPAKSVELPESIVRAAEVQARLLGVSTEQWIETAVAERIRLENADAEYFRARAARASGRPLGEILDQGRDNPPDPGDEL